MTSTNEWAQRRRDDKAAAAEQGRRDAAAAAERALHAEAVRAEIAERRRTEATRRQTEEKTAAQQRATVRRAAAASWLAEHRVNLLIYPLAVASAVMAVPAMAAYGAEIYGGLTGAVLPVISELGMWAFAFAVQARRRTEPTAPAWSLQVGVWVFAAVAAGLNIAHGLHGGLSAALVMGVVSIAGVIAHQLVTAGPSRIRRGRASRAQRAAMRKLAAARRAAVDAAVAEVDTDGDARLVIAPGTYRVSRRWTGRPCLAPHATPGLPVEDPGAGEELAGEIAAWLATEPPSNISASPTDDPAAGTGNHDSDPPTGRGIATLDHPGDGSDNEQGRRRRTRPTRRPHSRSLAQLRTELAAAVAAGEVDPTSAESIRTTLRCAPARARALRDEHTDSTRQEPRRTGGEQR